MTQKTFTLSSAEAELLAAVKTATGVMGVAQTGEDFGHNLGGRIFLDSNAANGVTNPRGHGKLRHVKAATLRIQEKVANKVLRVRKIKVGSNPAARGIEKERQREHRTLHWFSWWLAKRFGNEADKKLGFAHVWVRLVALCLDKPPFNHLQSSF